MSNPPPPSGLPLSPWGEALRKWRQQQQVKQLGLATALGVTQSTIAKWESGADLPSPRRQRQIRDLIAGTLRNEAAIERLAIQHQSSIRALIDLDGMRTEVISAGYRKLWPEFSLLIGERLGGKLVNESRLIVEDEALMQEMRSGRVALITGVSLRHVESPLGDALLHRWQIALRRFGSKIFADMLFEPCHGPEPTGIERVIRLDAFGEIDESGSQPRKCLESFRPCP